MRTVLRDRASLLRTTALQAAVLTVIAGPAVAQPAPNARPTGGQVVAGSAAINQADPSATIITQSTNRAAINWQGFSVGSQQSVQFQQPSTSAVTLNRVTGADPSAIAGRITANGGVVLTNPNGVVFYNGAQVNAQDVIVSTIGISNQNFMAGKMVFDQPGHPGAGIANAGTITVKDTGLAALVAPQVANSGVISAHLGHAVLAGAEAATLDMYGDGLLAVDVTKQVTQAPKGGAALVTNTGVVVANGGEVLLTAKAADGVVTNLVSAGGRIAADTEGTHTGTVRIAGTGGGIVISGSLSASGVAAGTTGGAIELNADRSVTLTPTARVSAAGAAGGGLVAIGTSLRRAASGAPKSGNPVAGATASVTIAPGARVTASATQRGTGGRVAILATQSTTVSGTVTAKGGAQAGNGGTVEISTGGNLTIDGRVDVTAARGAMGDIVIDPYDLTINGAGSNTTLTDNTNPNLAYSAGGTTIGNNATITPSQIEALHGNIHLQAVDDITVNAPVSLTTAGQGFTLEAGNNLAVATGVTISTGGSIALLAASSGIPGFNAAGSLTMAGSIVTTGGNITLQGGTSGTVGAGGVIVAGGITAPTGFSVDLIGDNVSLQTGANISVPGGNLIIEPYSAGRAIALIGTASAAPANALSVTTTELAQTTTGTLTLGNASAGAITIGVTNDAVGLGAISTLNLRGNSVAQGAALTVGTLTGAIANGATLTNAANQIGTLTNFSAGNLAVQDAISLSVTGNDVIAGSVTIGDAGSVVIGGTLSATGTLAVNVAGSLTETAAGAISNGDSTLILTGTAGSATLLGNNQIDVLGSLTTTGALALNSLVPITVAGPVTAGGALSITDAGAIALAGNVTAPTVSFNAGDDLTQTVGTIATGTLFAVGSTITLADANSIANLGSLNAGGDATLVDAAALTVSGPVSALGDISLTTGGALTIGSTIATAGNLTIVSGGSIAETAAGIIFAGTLNGSNGGGGTSLTSANEIASIGTFTSTGGFVLDQDATALTVNGQLTDDTVISLSTQGQILLAGTLSAPTVNLTTTETFAPLNSGSNPVTAGQLAGIDSIIQSGGGITADVLNISSGGGVNMQQSGTTNSVSNIGTVTAANQFNLVDQVPVTITGPGIVSGPTINHGFGTDFYYQYYVSSPGDVIVSAPVSGAVVGLFAGGQLAETATGTITTGFLQGAGANVSLTQTANSITEIDSLISSANIAVTSATPLNLNGALTAADGGTVAIANNALTFGANAALTASDGVVQLAPVNPGDAFTIGGGTLGIGPITANTLVIGAATAGTVTVNTTGSSFNASGVGTLTVLSAADVVETGTLGLVANVLSGGVGGAATFAAAGNQVTTLGSFSVGSLLTLATANDTGTPLTIAGPVTGNVAISSSTTPIVISGAITGGSVSLATSGTGGGISESTGGGITATTLTTTVTGATRVSLTGANTIAGVGTISTGSGGFTLTDATALSVGAGDAIGATGPVVLTIGGSLAIGGLIGGTGAALSLTAAGPITESAGGALTGTSLTGTATSATLTAGTNSIGTLSGFTTTNGFQFTDATALTVGGAVTDPTLIVIGAAGNLTESGALTAPAISLITTNGGNIALGANLAPSTGLVLEAAGAITQTAGTISTPALTGSAGGAVALNDANTIGAVGNFTAGGSFSLHEAGAIVIGSTLSAPAVNLVAGGTIGEGTTAALITSLLTGSGSAVVLPNAANQIGGLGAIAAAGSIQITDAVPVTVSGNVTAGGASVIDIVDNTIGFATGGTLATAGNVVLEPTSATSTLTLSGSGAGAISANGLVIGAAGGGPVSIAGLINLAGVGGVFLESAGAISETAAGGLTANTVTVTAASAALGGANTIAQLGSVTTSGAFALNDSGNLVLTAPVTAPSVSLTAGGTISESGGVINTGTFSGSAAEALLTGANSIANLAAFTGTTALVLTDNASLAVTGPVSGGFLTGLVVTGGSLTIGGTIGGTVVSLAATGAVSETTGVIAAGTLGVSGSTVALGGANSIANLGSVTTSSLALNDTQTLTLIGPVNAGASATISDGQVVTESSTGSLTANTLSVNVGNLELGGNNTIGTLAMAIANTGELVLNDSQSLLVSGPVYAVATPASARFSDAQLSAAGGITIAGTVSGVTVELNATRDITEQGTGSLTAVTVSGSWGNITLTGNNNIGALGSITSSGVLNVAEGGSLAIAGPVSASAFNFNLSGALTETAAGSLTLVNALSGTAPGGIVLSSANNRFPSTGPLSTQYSLSLTDAADLTLLNSITAGNVNLSVAGNLVEAAGGAISTSVLAGNVGNANLGSANTIGAIGSFTATGGFTLQNTPSLAIIGPLSTGSFTLVDTGAVTIAGNLTAPAGLSLTAGGTIMQTGGLLTTGLLTGSAVGAAVFGPDAPGPLADIAQLGPFTVSNGTLGSGTLSVASNQAMAVSGPVTAATLNLSAPGAITLAGGTITTNTGTIAVIGASTATILQTGTTDIASASGGTAQLTFLLPGAGSLQFADLSAPTTTVTLNTGSGSSTGEINVGSLAVIGSGGSASLIGSIGGNGTANAALLATISPSPSVNYTFNTCEIAAVSCTVTIQPPPPPPPPPEVVQSIPRIESIILPPNSGVSGVPDVLSSDDSAAGARSAFRIPFLSGLLAYIFSRDVDDPDLVLPNISDRDY